MEDIDLNSISHWFATGFFENENKSFLFNSKHKNNFGPQIEWFYEPRNISFNAALNEFGDLFESVLKSKTKNKNIILPLSGGLDSRTIAAGLKDKKNVVTYSYEFEAGIPEIKYAENIANKFNWDFHKFIIKKGYLWNKIDKLASINSCRTEFTHSRQMAVIEEVSKLGDILISGSLGDLLFDSYSLSDKLGDDEIKNFFKKIILKPSGLEFVNDLWSYWGKDYNYNTYLCRILDRLYKKIDISNNSNKAKALKVEYYVKNWTNINLNIFNSYVPTFAPYHDDRLCKFICTIPEKFLKNRKIQIAYIKKKAPILAKIPWQSYDLNLYEFHRFNTLYFPRRVYRYINRKVRYKILKKYEPITRNWEIQFTGKKNKKHLENWLFNNKKFNLIIPSELVSKFYNKFKYNDKVYYSHIISMLLTFSVWSKKINEN